MIAEGGTQKTHRLVQAWVEAKKRAERADRELNAAQCERDNAANELGKWLVPEGFTGERFNIWFGSGIIQAVRLATNPDHYTVSWLKKPDGKDSLEFPS